MVLSSMMITIIVEAMWKMMVVLNLVIIMLVLLSLKRKERQLIFPTIRIMSISKMETIYRDMKVVKEVIYQMSRLI